MPTPKNSGLIALTKLAQLLEEYPKDLNSCTATIESSSQTLIERQNAVKFVEASNALEGYAPITPEDELTYELREMWINGQIDTEERIRLLKKALSKN
ncbi:antitoxin VbhA family protein [Arenicella xantha]|uniref:Antitoxin VbhA domain-containing protein n=1 Tax=Arenicella xantha TaxID=644221 RepID=A0A395JSS1_9GAMM|nr:antitoxin VbhA family protein [Arenicella xantha]RBP53516.1 hypothetical protein DFR28_101903 [Arenicella xantha]